MQFGHQGRTTNDAGKHQPFRRIAVHIVMKGVAAESVSNHVVLAGQPGDLKAVSRGLLPDPDEVQIVNGRQHLVENIATNLALRKEIPINKQSKTPKLIAVNGDELQIDRMCILHITNLHNGISKTIIAIVSPDVSDDFIIGYPQLKVRLG